jgi:hypothetical protein
LLFIGREIEDEADLEDESSSSSTPGGSNPNIDLSPVKREPKDVEDQDLSESEAEPEPVQTQERQEPNKYVPGNQLDQIWMYFNCTEENRKRSKASCKFCDYSWTWPKIERVKLHLEKFHPDIAIGDASVLPKTR